MGDKFAEVVGTTTVLATATRLHLADNRLSVRGLRYIGGWLKSSYLLFLDLSHNKLGLAGAKFLADSIGASTCLEHLNLEACSLSDRGVYYLAKGLYNTRSLNRLILRNNGINKMGATELGRLLEYQAGGHGSVAEQLGTDAFSPTSKQISKRSLLQSRTRPTTVDSQDPGSPGASPKRAPGGGGGMFDTRPREVLTHTPPADARRRQKAHSVGIKELDLAWNKIHGVGAQGLLDGLKRNQALQALDLSWNALGSAARGQRRVGGGGSGGASPASKATQALSAVSILARWLKVLLLCWYSGSTAPPLANSCVVTSLLCAANR